MRKLSPSVLALLSVLLAMPAAASLTSAETPTTGAATTLETRGVLRLTPAGENGFAPQLALLDTPALSTDAPVDAPPPASKPFEIPVAQILLGLAVLTAILPMTNKLPGWGTISNIAMGVVGALTVAFTGLATTHPKAAVGIVLFTAVGAVIGYFRSETRAGLPSREVALARAGLA